VVIVATNHLEAFDIAISRPGRFDAILQVMPPTVPEKLRQWRLFKTWLPAKERDEILGPLTYAECKLLANRLKGVTSPVTARKFILRDVAECTLNSKATKTQTWSQVCAEQKDKSRVL
jgi:SpoVK/Ycf46/Vps4 family AAA+-type ATPase